MRVAKSKLEERLEQSMLVKKHSETIGVSYHITQKKWLARIDVNKKRIHLGCFDSEEAAILARQNAEQHYKKQEVKVVHKYKTKTKTQKTDDIDEDDVFVKPPKIDHFESTVWRHLEESRISAEQAKLERLRALRIAANGGNPYPAATLDPHGNRCPGEGGQGEPVGGDAAAP